MLKILMIFVGGIFMIYIFVCSYKFLTYRKARKIVLRVMTYYMILFTFTIVCYGNIFFKGNDTNGRYSEFSEKEGSKVFLSSIVGANSVRSFPQDDSVLKNNDKELDLVNKQEIEVKITAYFDNAEPPRGSITNLIITGPPKGRVTAICQYKGHGTPYIMDIGANGQAVIPINVENDAEPGLLVVVDIAVSYDGKQYNANTVFTPQ